MANREMNFFKMLFLLNMAFTFFLIVLLWLTPTHTKQAEAYGWFFAGWFGMFIVDLLLYDFPYSELIDTITADVNEEKYPLQWFGVAPQYVFLFAIIAGLLLSVFYSYEIVINKKVFISVPNLFSAVPLTQAITAQTFDILESGWMVATVEEQIWTGFMMPVFWAIFFVLIYTFFPAEKPALLVALVIASLLTGYLVAYWFHPFVYGGNQFAYANAWGHFTMTSLLAGATGTTIGGIIAHGIHNSVAKISIKYGTYSVLPLESYISQGGGQNNNLTFPQ